MPPRGYRVATVRSGFFPKRPRLSPTPHSIYCTTRFWRVAPLHSRSRRICKDAVQPYSAQTWRAARMSRTAGRYIAAPPSGTSATAPLVLHAVTGLQIHTRPRSSSVSLDIQAHPGNLRSSRVLERAILMRPLPGEVARTASRYDQLVIAEIHAPVDHPDRKRLPRGQIERGRCLVRAAARSPPKP